MQSLRTKRPLFYNEADLQHALAWELHLAHPDADLRLEVPQYGGRVDLFFAASSLRMAIELKYPRARYQTELPGEPAPYARSSPDAVDDTRYAIVQDIERLERVVGDGTADAGCLLLLTNESSFWRTPRRATTALDAKFRIHEGAVLAGALKWGAGGRPKDDIALGGEYTAGWRDYSELPVPPTTGAATFRYLSLLIS
jgi:hypothetical protein